VQWWEFFIVILIVVAFSVVMEAYVNEVVVRSFMALVRWTTGSGMRRRSREGESVLNAVQSIIRELTFAEVTPKTSLREAGLSSMMTVILVSEIKKVFKTLKLTSRDVSQSDNVAELVDVIEGRLLESATRPELALGKRTAVGAPKAMKKMTREESKQGRVQAAPDTGGGADDGRLGSSPFGSSNRGSSRRPGVYQTLAWSLLVPVVFACTNDSKLFCCLGLDVVGNNETRKSSMTSTRSRRAAFLLNETAGFNEGRRHGGLSVTARQSNGASRISFKIQGPNEPNTPRRRASTRSTVGHRLSMAAVASTSSAIRLGSNPPKR
jgi:acyl carrier protein